jgi:hypothetical protein
MFSRRDLIAGSLAVLPAMRIRPEFYQVQDSVMVGISKDGIPLYRGVPNTLRSYVNGKRVSEDQFNELARVWFW